VKVLSIDRDVEDLFEVVRFGKLRNIGETFFRKLSLTHALDAVRFPRHVMQTYQTTMSRLTSISAHVDFYDATCTEISIT
jgi:hypothetical protein